MAHDDKKLVRRTYPLDQRDIDAIEAVAVVIDWVSMSAIVRAALRAGLLALIEDPTLVGIAPLDSSKIPSKLPAAPKRPRER